MDAKQIEREPADLVVEPGDEYVMIETDTRQAHICCGCDTRNAVLVVNSFGICFYTLMVVSFSLLYGDTLQYDDDLVQSVMDRRHNIKTGLTLFFYIAGLACSSMGLYGGVKFNTGATSIGGLWYLFEAIRSIFLHDPFGMALALGFSYPHAVFCHEMKNGVMTPQTYEKERVCCGCCTCC